MFFASHPEQTKEDKCFVCGEISKVIIGVNITNGKINNAVYCPNCEHVTEDLFEENILDAINDKLNRLLNHLGL